MKRGAIVLLALSACWPGLAGAAGPTTGFQAEVPVRQATRLDWAFAAGPGARLPTAYESTRQRYQLYVPPSYRADRAWPLVVFLSPGDAPLGWPAWQQPCEEGEVLFCAAYAAGNNAPRAVRTRVVLDVLDDVRRHYRIDPEQTYLAGFAGGAVLACRLAFALPEYFGGVVALSDAAPPEQLTYLTRRARNRLSLALVTGADDFERSRCEALTALFAELGLRSRLSVVQGVGHALPPAAVLAGVLDWLRADLPRRRADVRAYPGLAASPDEVLTDRRRAERVLSAARDELRQGRLADGVALLEGIVARWGRTDAVDAARALLVEIQADPARATLLRRQREEEERRVLPPRARTQERLGRLKEARQTWQRLARSQPATPEGEHAAAEADRLAAVLADRPYLGLGLEGQSLMVGIVIPHGPAERAGLRPGDRLVRLGETALAGPTDLRRALEGKKPGARLPIEIRRDGRSLTLSLKIGRAPASEPSPQR